MQIKCKLELFFCVNIVNLMFHILLNYILWFYLFKDKIIFMKFEIYYLFKNSKIYIQT